MGKPSECTLTWIWKGQSGIGGAGWTQRSMLAIHNLHQAVLRGWGAALGAERVIRCGRGTSTLQELTKTGRSESQNSGRGDEKVLGREVGVREGGRETYRVASRRAVGSLA